MRIIDRVRPTLTEVLRKNESLSSDLSGGGYCATFERSVDGEPWVQVKTGILNFFYPSDEPPVKKLKAASVELPTNASCVDWKPWSYATFEFEPVTAEELAETVELLFVRLYGFPDDLELSCESSDMR